MPLHLERLQPLVIMSDVFQVRHRLGDARGVAYTFKEYSNRLRSTH